MLERDREIGLLRQSLERARRGVGGLVMVEGEQGTGKSSLLQHARAEADGQAFQVLNARGSTLEQGFSWAVVRQLFEHQPVDRAERALEERVAETPPLSLLPQLNSDSATTQGESEDGGDALYSLLQGIYGICRDASLTSPLLLLVDDAQWIDTESARFINYLVNRLENHKILVVLAVTCGAHEPVQDLLMAVCGSPVAALTRLAPLSKEAVRRRITERLGRDVHDGVLRACFDLTEGNPLHLAELLDQMIGLGLTPDESSIPEILLLTPARISWHMRSRLRALPPTAEVLASAIAVLNGHAEPQHCAQVSGLDEAEMFDAAGCLRDADVLRPGMPYRFRRAAMRQVVYSHMSPRDRGSAHRRSARSLQTAGAQVSEVAEHLVRTDPAGDPWAVTVLRSASRGAMLGGDPRAAIRYLRHALAEPLSEQPQPAILAQLGSAELRAHRPSAVDRLVEAQCKVEELESGSAVRADLGVALAASARYEEALAVLSQDQNSASGQVRALASVLSRLIPGELRRRVTPVVVPGTRALRAHAAAEALSRGLHVRRVRRLAAAALADGDLATDHDTELTSSSIAAWTLAQCDDLSAAERALEEHMRRAAACGQLLTVDTAQSLRARVLYDTGRLEEAEQTARVVLRHQSATSLRPACVPLAAAVLVHCLIDTGRPEEAAAFLDRTGLTGQLPEAAMFVPLSVARGRLSIRLARFGAGLAEIVDCRDLAARQGWWYPSAICEYLSDSVRALVRSGEPAAAAELALGELERARAFGAARPLAVALRTYGELKGGAEGLVLVEEAHRLLDGLPDSVERARTLVALGSVLRRAGQRSAARRRLDAGRELAQKVGATELEAEARSELRLAGARPTRSGSSASVPLTPAEERVAQRAATGLSNREIAQALFVTVKTVEWHLSQTYAKLGIAKRSELSDALSGATCIEDSSRRA
ncbi:helix-turn-helix transcriptional regulator [Streptomyces microflavus]|uniref:helix-turn-helix transcriptional regulator n=1 Tax=Streptomyces microflavus TaxID=1919 RepID=UPI0033B1F7D2